MVLKFLNFNCFGNNNNEKISEEKNFFLFLHLPYFTNGYKKNFSMESEKHFLFGKNFISFNKKYF